MRILFVHDRFGALAGAEANVYITASEFNRRGHTVGIIHGPPTGKGHAAWEETFPHRFPEHRQPIRSILSQFCPDVVYVHKMADLATISALVESGIPLVRMIHDHDIYCMRSYKYNYFTREICTKPAGPHCLFPCGAFIARDRSGLLPVKWVSYRAKKQEIHLNR